MGGKAMVDRYLVHERSGSQGTEVHGYQCYAQVTIPLQQLEQAQVETLRSRSTPGGGWTCGSEDYECSFFLRMCLLNALRVKLDNDEGADEFILQKTLNKKKSQDYPYCQMTTSDRSFGGITLKVSQSTIDLIKHFREKTAGKDQLDMDEIMQL